MSYKNIVISFIILSAIGLASWTTFLSFRPLSIPATLPSQLPDGFMEDVNATIMNKQGKVSMKIVTPKMIHYAENDTSDLTDPQLTLYRRSPQPWYITAKYAKATQGIENVTFWQDVNVHHSADESNPATLIQTAKLLVHPNKQTAETADPITMTQPNLVVKATGMYADMNKGDIKLLSQARGEYVPNP